MLRPILALMIAVLTGAAFGQTSSGVKRRNVTLEEASDLVYVYLKSVGCTRNMCSVDQIHDPYWPGFYSFSAMWPNQYGSRYFKVDPLTGDLWDGVACGGFTSPSLARLQYAIRKRIGLSDEEYKKTPSNAPMCEAGQKPHVTHGK
jgi:hypothetical protein